MTDREKLIALLEEFGVAYNGKVAQHNSGFHDFDFESEVVLHVGDYKIEGYTNFFAEFAFHPDGSFNKILVGE